MYKKIFILLLWIPLCYAPDAARRNLIIFLDFHQSESALKTLEQPAPYDAYQGSIPPALGANSFALLPALYQKSAPIMASTSLIKNILSHRQTYRDFLQLKTPELLSRYNERVRFSQPGSIETFKSNCHYIDRTYKGVQEMINRLIGKGSKQEIQAAMEKIVTHQPFSEEAAPHTLRFYAQPSKLNESMYKELGAYLMCAHVPFDDYVVKLITKELTLLIPKTYIKKFTHESVLFNNTPQITPAEKALGLRLNHLADVQDLSRLMQGYPMSPKITFTPNLSKLFVTNDQVLAPHSWVIYLAGHGLGRNKERMNIEQLTALRDHYKKKLSSTEGGERVQWAPLNISQRLELINSQLWVEEHILKTLTKDHEESICALPGEEFTKLLEFFDKRITTSLLSYTSCYAGGEHIIKPYQKMGKDLMFNFDIICVCASDCTAKQCAPMLLIPPYSPLLKKNTYIDDVVHFASINPKTRSMGMYTTTHFDEFFKSANETKERNYYHLASLLHPYIDQKGKPLYFGNIAHVRKAGSTTFQLALPSETFMPLNDDTAIYCPSTKVEALYFTSQNAPPLIFDKEVKEIPTFLSLHANHSWHVLPSIEAENVTFFELVSSFLRLDGLEKPKMSWIKKLVCRNSADLPGNNKATLAILENVVILQNVMTSENLKNKSYTCVYFTDHVKSCWHVPYGADIKDISLKPISFKPVLQELKIILPSF